MSRAIRSCCLLFVALVSGHTGLAQLNLHIDEHFFAGKEIYKVETTNDGWVWVLGEDNFIARISPSDEVEVLTAFFADYSTKPFTDISSHMSDTLLLGTKGDYAYLFANGDIKQLGPDQGLTESIINSVIIKKQYYHQYSYISDYNDVGKIALVTDLSVYRSTDFEYFNKHTSESFLYNKEVSFQQNDRKGFALSIFYGDDVGGGACYGADVSNIDLVAGHQGGYLLWNTPIDVFAHAPDSLRAVYTSSRVKGMFDYNFVKYWAGKTGLNYLANAPICHQPSEPIHFFDDKEVSSIGELHLLGAATEDYLTFILVGTSTGLFVSNESQKQYFSTAYSRATVLGEIAINDMESISDGVPVEINGWSVYYPFSFCEQRMYVATANGLFKLDYSIAPASYEHLGSTLYYNDNYLDSDTLIICGDDDHMLRVPFSIGSNNSIQWQRNGQDIIGADSNAVYLSESGTYRSVMWFGCENIETYSKEVTVSIDDTPEFTFDYLDTVDVCEGDTFPLEVTGAQPGYRYQWFRNGAPIEGETLSLFTVTEEGMYHVGVNACGDHFVFSDSIALRFHRLEKPTTNDGNILVCLGQTRRLTVTGYPSDVIKRWYRDGELIPGESDTTLQVNEPGYYQVGLTRGPCSVMSDPLTVRFELPPVAQIQALDEGPLCYGTSTTLTADHPAAGAYTYNWSTGETTRSIQVNTAGVYTLVLTNAAGCSDTAAFEVEIYAPLPTLQIRDTVICTVENSTVRVEAPAGYSNYYWNGGASGSPYLDIAAAGTYTLQVADENGCTTTTTFEVRSSCKDPVIPNTFSPNGDGFNDTWVIEGIDDQAATVTVFDRNGQLVFQSHGYSVPWDGLYKGRLVPVGAYYYHIATSAGVSFKGALNVLY